MATSEIVKFPSLGETAVGRLYLPENLTGKVAAVVSSAGFGGVKEMMLPDFCVAFQKAGIACLIFDFIGFGESTGKLRQDVSPTKQLQTTRDAINFLTTDERLDSSRLGIWGPSLMGGHALVISGTEPRIKAAVAIIPHISVRSAGAARPDLALAVVKDLARRMIGGPRATIPAAGRDGEFAVMNTDGAEEWIEEKSAGCTHFRNEVTVSSIHNMFWYSTESAAKNIKIPLLAITAKDDQITPAANVHKALAGVKSTTFKDFPGTHFGLFGEFYQEVITLTVEWMQQHL